MDDAGLDAKRSSWLLQPRSRNPAGRSTEGGTVGIPVGARYGASFSLLRVATDARRLLHRTFVRCSDIERLAADTDLAGRLYWRRREPG